MASNVPILSKTMKHIKFPLIFQYYLESLTLAARQRTCVTCDLGHPSQKRHLFSTCLLTFLFISYIGLINCKEQGFLLKVPSLNLLYLLKSEAQFEIIPDDIIRVGHDLTVLNVYCHGPISNMHSGIPKMTQSL